MIAMSKKYIKIPIPESLDASAAETLIRKNLLGSMDNAEEMMEDEDRDYSKIYISNRLTEMSEMLENMEVEVDGDE